MTRTLEQLANVRMGDMSPAERRIVVTAACAKLERQLKSPAMQKALADAALTLTEAP
jgi:hypothetical protein